MIMVIFEWIMLSGLSYMDECFFCGLVGSFYVIWVFVLLIRFVDLINNIESFFYVSYIRWCVFE